MSIQIGKRQRLGEILNSKDGKAMMVAADHAQAGDPTSNVIYFRSIIPRVVAGNPDALMVNYGQAFHMGHLLKGKNAPALIVRADRTNGLRLGMASQVNSVPVRKLTDVAAVTVEDCLRVGASAIMSFLLVGYSDEIEIKSLKICAKYAKECRRLGMPLIIEVMPVGAMVSGTNIVDLLVNSSRMAVEIGADALKIQYTGDVETCAKVINGCEGVPVFLLGGARSENPRDSLEIIKEGLEAGASGVVFGRNIIQSKDPEKAVRDMVDLVHGRRDINEILGVEKRLKASVKIKVNFEKCTGCKLCETVCSFKKSNSYSDQFATVKIKSQLIDSSLNLKEKVFKPVICNQCGKCIKECPLDALHFSLQTGALELDADKCTGCQKCVEVCPWGLIKFDNEKNIPLFCDLCGGEPECVRWCPTGALELGKGSI